MSFKTYLSALVAAVVNATSSKAAYSNASAPMYLQSSQIVINTNGATSPCDGICVVRSNINATGNYGVFIYINDNQQYLNVIGVRASGSNECYYNIPVRKGDSVLVDYDNASFVSMTFFKTVGSS